MKRVFWFLVLVSLLTACKSVEKLAGNQPIIDTKNVNLVQYDADLAECQDYAYEVAVAQKTVSSTVAGAAIGGLFGAVLGNSNTAQRGAGVGAIGGGSRGIGESIRERDQVIKNCLHGRGYHVLN